MNTQHTLKRQTQQIAVEEADAILRAAVREFGNESIPIESAMGRVLAQPLYSDRDFPPFDRVTMDGIAINYDEYKKGRRTFKIERCVLAGQEPGTLEKSTGCIEVMTGAPIPGNADTVVRYEDLAIENNSATINAGIIYKGLNIHKKGSGSVTGDILVNAGTLIDASVLSMCASVGNSEPVVKKLPRVAFVSTGDELVDITRNPLAWQIRISNAYLVAGRLGEFGIHTQLFHVKDNYEEASQVINDCIDQFDVVLLSGGVSMGKSDLIPRILEANGVNQLFYKVQQRPGKPLWFGQNQKTTVFAFPGNPVSTFLCLHRYFIPWLQQCLQMKTKELTAILQDDVEFEPELQYFLQVKLDFSNGKTIAIPLPGKGSGDHVNLLHVDAFMELPGSSTFFPAGSVYRVWPFKNIF